MPLCWNLHTTNPMKHINNILLSATVLIFVSCQSSSEVPKFAEPIPEPKPFPAWTRLANQPASSKNSQQIKVITRFIEISTLAEDANAPELTKKQT